MTLNSTNRIIFVEYVASHVSKRGQPYKITHAVLDDGTEAEGFGNDFKVGDKVEVFFDWGKIKMSKVEWGVNQQ